jgi:hypothetical protein
MQLIEALGGTCNPSISEFMGGDYQYSKDSFSI